MGIGPMLSRGRRRKSGILRALRWLAFVPLASRLPMYSKLIWALLKDNRIPASRKAILAGAAGYVLVGRDIVPDEIPVIGAIDDLAVVVLAVELFLDGIPDEILDEKFQELDIDGDIFRRDMDQVRRLTPAPVRKVIARLPDALDGAGRLAKQLKLGPMIRTWIEKSWATKEESFA